MTRNGIITRKIVLESVSGSNIRDANQLSMVADTIGARRKTLHASSAYRIRIEDNEKITPLVEKLARKSPEGDSVISYDWKLKAVNFYEANSEIIKGHHSVYKDRIKGDLGQSDVTILRPKRVLQVYILHLRIDSTFSPRFS